MVRELRKGGTSRRLMEAPAGWKVPRVESLD